MPEPSYPYYNDLQKLTKDFAKGNFGLWFNKFIPLNNFDSCNASDEKGKKENAVSYYHRQYMNLRKNTIRQLLEKKHDEQTDFCQSFSQEYEQVVFKAKLRSPLITGIGESHPHEASMVFDHNIGIPYIPASGVKGIARFAHALSLLDSMPKEMIKKDNNGKEYFDEEDAWTNIPELFGTQKNRGNVVFLDVYPEKVPELHVDIMNPHYGDYYGDDKGKVPPADYLNPNPIKFLTVATGTVFIFRALVDREHQGLTDKVKAAFIKALTEEGVGSKTAVGYGIFEVLQKSGPAAPKSLEADSDNIRQEKLSKFRDILKNTQNLAGDIDHFIGRVNAQEEEGLKRELCKILLDRAMSLPKKKKFSKALAAGKSWAKRLKALCDQLGVDI